MEQIENQLQKISRNLPSTITNESELIEFVASKHSVVNFLQSLYDGKVAKYKETAEKRIKKSKFANLIAELTDEEIKAVFYCILVSKKSLEALKCYFKIVDKSIVDIALEVEYLKRTNGIKDRRQGSIQK